MKQGLLGLAAFVVDGASTLLILLGNSLVSKLRATFDSNTGFMVIHCISMLTVTWMATGRNRPTSSISMLRRSFRIRWSRRMGLRKRAQPDS